MVAIDHPLLAPWRGRQEKYGTGTHGKAAHAENASAADSSKGEHGAFVAALKIGGTIKGNRLQVMIEGILYGVGDVIDPARGVMVMKIEDDARRVTFIDPAGRTYTRSF